jgi:hypothetical protein
MDVSVHYKRQQRRLRSVTKASVLGDGLLVRVRSTSLALLGLTAAVGLAMVAVALNQDWPLIAGAPIPGFADEQQAVGDATVAAEARAPSGPFAALRSTARREDSRASVHPVKNGMGGTPAQAGSPSPELEGTVVSHSTPASSPGDGPSGDGSPGGAPPSPVPVTQQPATAAAPEPVSSPAAAPPNPTPSQPTPEPATPSQSTLVSDQSGEHDHGHHFGRGGSRSYGHSRSRDDSDATESGEEPETAPSPPVAPPPDTDSPEESEGQSHAPPWSHGGGHGYGHDHSHW